MKNAKKVVFNTGVLYIRLIIGLLVGLFTTRLVLEALGETDYGIYMLVAGVVAMLGILNSNMSNTSMRFIAHSLGSNNKKHLIQTFNTTIILHFAVALLVVLIMLIGGYFLFEFIINIPENRIYEAKVVFGCMLLTTLITVISVPYDALINAHENLLILSLAEIFGDLLKLAIAVYLLYSNSNLLIKYGILMLVVQILLRLIKQWYCRVKYDESKFVIKAYNKKILKTILNFTGWNLLASVGAMAVTQARGLILNIFFGVRINTSEGIARSGSIALNMVSTNLTGAINPQMVKSEGAGNRERMKYIIGVSTKYSIFLFSLFAIPVLFESNLLLEIWLNEVPDYTVVFLQITILHMLVEKFTFPITDAIRAVGNIRNFQITETLLFISNIPIGYFIFKMDYGPESIYIVGIVLSFFILINRLYFGKIIVGIKPLEFLNRAVIPTLGVVLLASSFTLIPYFILDSGILRLCVIVIIFVPLYSILFWWICNKKSERMQILKILNSFREKI